MIVTVLLACLVAVAVVLSQAQDDAQNSALQRWSERAEISAALTQSVFSALGTASNSELQRHFGGPPAKLRRELAARLRESRARYLGVTDSRGNVLAVAGKPPARLTTRAGGHAEPLLSNVMGKGKARFVQYTIPFGPRGNRRAMVQGVPMQLLARFFGDYLARLREVDGAGLAMTDENGQVITRKGRISLRDATAPGRLATHAAVPGTPWTLRLEAERDRVLAGATGTRTLAWLILGALALAVAAGTALYARLARMARRQREANVALHESREQLSNLVDALEEAVFIQHADGATELLNASAKELLDTELDAMDAMHLMQPGWKLLDTAGEPMDSSATPVQRAFESGSARSMVVGLERPDGHQRWLAVRARPLFRPGEERPHAVVSSCTDVSQQREVELHLTDLAQRDSLTGLWNRRRFEEDLAKQLERCRRYGERAALLVLDLDGFKEVNDTFGHLVGDEVLCALGEGLRQRLRATDSAARMGGDEFAVLLVHVDSDEAQAAATEVAARLTEFAREELGGRATLELSVGLTLIDSESGGMTDVLAAADRDMYVQKRRLRVARAPSQAPAAPLTAETIQYGGSAAGDARFSSVRALLTAVQARDSYTAAHSRQVVNLARVVARRLGLGQEEAGEIESAALLHDLGKIAVPDAILRKRGPLTEEEQEIMRQHPVVGAQMVSSIPGLEHLGPAIRAEHERWDGSGYPDGLAGEAIPLASRITFVCDAYHAMTHDRPYRRALSHEEAVAEIQAESGSQFCPAAAAALVEVLQSRGTGGRRPARAAASA